MRVDTARIVHERENRVRMRQRNGERVEAAVIRIPEPFTASICSMIACVDTLIDGTAMRPCR